MERIGKSIIVGLAIFFLIILSSAVSPALTMQEIMNAAHIANLEARPKFFSAGQPIDFLVIIKYDGGTQDGFDVGVFHEGRLVGWQTNLRLNHGLNTFKLHDRHFTGDPGAYIVRLRYQGNIFRERRFQAISKVMFTIDPAARFP